jgi:micrococcal nuclease
VTVFGLLVTVVGVVGLIAPRWVRLPRRAVAVPVLVVGLVLLASSSSPAPDQGPASSGAPGRHTSATTAPPPTTTATGTPGPPAPAAPATASPGPATAPAGPRPALTAARPLATTGILTRAVVDHVVDGDTIDVTAAVGAPLPAHRIRLIGVDTPESTWRVEPYGAQAAAYTTRQLAGRTVWLTRDVSQTDRYGRALRYVWLTRPPAHPTEADLRRHLFNAVLVRAGYAQVATYPPDVAYVDALLKFQREARRAGRGLWGLDQAGGAAPAPHGVGQAGCDPNYAGACVPPYPPDVDCGDLPAGGFRVVGSDPHHLDGDGDGVAC